MGILVDYEIEEWAWDRGFINCSPFSKDHVNPASLDLTLDTKIIDLHTNEELFMYSDSNFVLHQNTIGVQVYNWFAEKINKMFDSHLPRKSTAILACTKEWVNFDDQHCAEMKMKTTPCRKGLGHPIADWVDPGFSGQLTMMLYANKDINLYAGMRICQLVIHKLDNSVRESYKTKGHYNNQSGPTRSWS